jgi:flagellar motor switch/type III secretory pathway protein FliN
MPSAGPFAWLTDVPCRVDVFLGTCRVKVRDCLAWQPNAIVALDQPAGADLELRADQVPLAVGEVVVTGGSAGLRVTRILPPQAEETAG